MTWDVFWQNLRYALIALGMFLAGRGWIPTDQVPTLVDSAITGFAGAVAFGTWAWGVGVKFGTKSVPAATAARSDVPTVSAATGEIQR